MTEEFLTNLIGLQSIGTALGVMQVLLARKNNIHNYLFGIASILIGLWVHYESKLYADLVLHLYYLGMSIYGWVYWKYGKQHEEAPISSASPNEYIKAIGIVVGCFILMSTWLVGFTDSDVPFWDATTSAFAWAGMWLMAKRKLQNWVFLNISNVISIPLLIYKDLYVYAGLTVFLFIVGTSGYFTWRKIIKNEQDQQPANA
ncbi:nicotinamide riboside transporter PnuC [Mesonia aquimarina]|uniref:nicotinamide riboside transporter PnuC n=1 Tax=Mesonia aquimarina TaxID=1504967 RepID=UPI000EF59969|nr:nicotinamide riboside transporter PnuC [Mesonia aquimarina]